MDDIGPDVVYLHDVIGITFRQIGEVLTDATGERVTLWKARNAYYKQKGQAKEPKPKPVPADVEEAMLPLATASGTMRSLQKKPPRSNNPGGIGTCPVCPWVEECHRSVDAGDYAFCEGPLTWELEKVPKGG